MKDDIIRMAREADPGFEGGPDADGTMGDSIVGIDAIERFAKLVAKYVLEANYPEMVAIVAAAEREECAKLCDEQHDRARTSTGRFRAGACAQAIRARGQA